MTTTGRADGELRAVLILSWGFMVLFSAYNTLQNYATSILPGNLGYHSLAVLYASAGVVVPFAPHIVARLGETRSMILGAILFVIYLVSLIRVNVIIVLICSACIGGGAAVLWVAQGVYITRVSSPGFQGTNVGIFWGIFQLCAVVGNGMAYGVFKYISQMALMIMFSVLGGVAVVILAFVPEMPTKKTVVVVYTDESPLLPELTVHPSWSSSSSSSPPTTKETASASPTTITHKQRWLRFFSAFRSTQVLLLLPSFFLTGMELSFWTGQFPPTLLQSDVIGLVLVFAGIGEIVGGVVIGRLSDNNVFYGGRKGAMALGGAVFMGSLCACGVLHSTSRLSPTFESASWLAYLAALGFGVADACFNTQVYAILGELPQFGTNVHEFTIFQLTQNVASAIGFYYSPLVSFTSQLYIQGSLCVLACALYPRVSKPVTTTTTAT